MSWVFITPKNNAKTAKKFLEEKGQYDKERKVTKFSDQEVMIPIKQEFAEQLKNDETKGTDKSSVLPLEGIIQCLDVQNVRKKRRFPQEKLKLAIDTLSQKKGVTVDEFLHKDLPSHWEQHGDLILLPEKSFTLNKWEQFGVELWKVVAETLSVTRLAKKSTINDDGFRTPKVSLLYGDNGWVMHIDNGIKYTFDVTKCMFSAGNITEKIRVGNFDCKGQTVVDLYAGIGYFVLPYLVHSKATMVYACEWNDNAAEALRRNLKLNGVDKQCVIYEGDNQKFPLRGVADHVNLGLIPSSEAGWPVACAALRSDTGGWLHVHGNVTSWLMDSEQRNGALSPTSPYFVSNETEDPNIKDHQLSVGDKVSNSEQALASSVTGTSNKKSPLRYMSNAENGHIDGAGTLLMKSHEMEEIGSAVHPNELLGRCDHSLCNVNQMPSCNRKLKPEWLTWSRYVAQSLLQHLRKSHDIDNWDVQIWHIEHVKSYAPHVDHIVLDVECCPLHKLVK